MLTATRAAPGEPPEWLSASERESVAQAKERAGDYCRGLGNAVAEDLEQTVAEVWSGEDILQEVQPTKRSRRLDIIRAKVAEAMTTHRDADQLARDLADATGDFGHNWKRIARTELQSVYNEGVLIAAAKVYGTATRIARIPESGACPHCKRLLLGEDGNPIVWRAEVLIANGVNVGRKPVDWKATVFAIHPHCFCGTISVPPGDFYVTPAGAIRKIGEAP
jgi:hypothetical protein